MTKAIKNIFSQSEYRLRGTQAFMAVCAMLAIMYGSNLYSVISNTVALQHLNSQSQALTTDVEKLDSQYLNLSSKITPDTLNSYGLQKGEVSFFISRAASLGRVAIRGNEF